MPVDWNELPRKTKIWMISGLIFCPTLAVILWRLDLPYTEQGVVSFAIVSWTFAILYKRYKRRKIQKSTGGENDL